MAVYLCCTCPEVAFGGCYPLSCPIKPGLSSYTAFRHCARGCSAYSDSYYTHSRRYLSTSVTLDPYCAAALGNKAKAGRVQGGKESMAVPTRDPEPGNKGKAGCVRWLFCGTGHQRDPAWGAKKVGEARCPDSHTFSALANTTGKGKESYGSSVTLARRFPPGRSLGRHPPQRVFWLI